jgi:inhibitor of growth protein 4
MALGPGVGVQHPLAAPADPNEPKYCVCNRVSFGEMIACENEACAVEWFHFACVGLSTDAKIKGKWFCATCSADIKRQKKLEKKREEAKDADKPGRK